MKSKELMQLGCMCGAVALFGAIVSSEFSVMTAMLGFGGGMLFGKGYGIWEAAWEKRNDT